MPKPKIILCLHGEGSHPAYYDENLLMPKAKMIWIQLPGFSTDGTGSREEVHKVLDKKFKEYPQAILLGHSYGAYLALSYARARPEKRLKIILVCPAGLFHNIGHPSLCWALLFKLSIPRLFSPLARGTGNKQIARHINVTMCSCSVSWDEPALDWIRYCEKVWIIFGENDVICPCEEAEAIQDYHFPDKCAGVYIVPYAGHNALREQPDRIKNYLLELDLDS